MVAWFYLPLALSAVFAGSAPAVTRRLPPPVATWLLSGGAAVCALASSASLALLAFLSVAQTPLAVAQGRWSEDVLRAHAGGPLWLGVLASAGIALAAVRLLRSAARRGVAVRDAYRLAAVLPARDGELAVVDAAGRDAFAVPGRPGRIVVTTALVRSLDADERRAVLAHERAHLRHRHYLHLSLAALAVALNPLLGRVCSALELACERWADEEAARVCSRSTVALALGRAAGHREAAVPAVVLGAADTGLAARVGALRAAPPALQLWRVGVLAALLAAVSVAVAVALHDTERLFELAQRAYLLGRR